jgi:glucosamine--fructose-6-phosphate aminotransferase (isomerizing)
MATVDRERSSAYTASHLGALLLAAQLARVLGADLVGLNAVPAAVDDAYRTTRDEYQQARPPSRLIEFIGGGINQWTAAEGAEGTRRLPTWPARFSVEQFLHGPSVALGENDRLSVLDGGGAWSEITEMRKRLQTVVSR